jgi:hypothetical protein
VGFATVMNDAFLGKLLCGWFCLCLLLVLALPCATESWRLWPEDT